MITGYNSYGGDRAPCTMAAPLSCYGSLNFPGQMEQICAIVRHSSENSATALMEIPSLEPVCPILCFPIQAREK